MKKISTLLRFLIFLPFLGLCIFFLYGALQTQQRQAQVAEFIPVPAQVIESRVQYIRTVSRRRWEVKITYSYTVNGTTYHSSRLGFGTRPAVEGYDGTEESYAASYPVGKLITAYYDPGNPSTAVLTRQQDASPLCLLIPLGLLVLFAGIIFGPLLIPDS